VEWSYVIALVSGSVTVALVAACASVIRTITNSNRIDALEIKGDSLAYIPVELGKLQTIVEGQGKTIRDIELANIKSHDRLERGQAATNKKLDEVKDELLRALKKANGEN
jgi:hypothetical protein